MSRGLQGLGSAIISPAALSILTTMSPEGPERNRALGAWAAVGAFGAVAGSLLGGVLTDLLSWEWVFYVNVPVGVAAIVLAPPLLSESRDAHASTFDLPGAALVTGGLVVLVYALTQANGYGWGSEKTLGLAALAVALLGAFVAWEARAKDPLMPFSIFRARTIVGANLAGLIVGTVVFSMFLMLTLYMQQVLGYSPLRTGFAYLVVAATTVLWSAVAANLVTRVGVKPVLIAGMVFLAAGLAYLHAGLAGRLLPRRPAARVPAGRGRDGLHDGAGLDRRARRRRAVGGGPRLGPDQHLPADRRRGRDRRPDRGRDLDHRQRDGRLPGRVRRRYRGRARGRVRRARLRARP